MTGVQTCALPISDTGRVSDVQEQERWDLSLIPLTILTGAATVEVWAATCPVGGGHDDGGIDTEVPQVYDWWLEAEHAGACLRRLGSRWQEHAHARR